MKRFLQSLFAPEPCFRILKQGHLFGIQENDIIGWEWLSEGYEYTSLAEAQGAIAIHKRNYADDDGEVVWEGS